MQFPELTEENCIYGHCLLSQPVLCRWDTGFWCGSLKYDPFYILQLTELAWTRPSSLYRRCSGEPVKFLKSAWKLHWWLSNEEKKMNRFLVFIYFINPLYAKHVPGKSKLTNNVWNEMYQEVDSNFRTVSPSDNDPRYDLVDISQNEWAVGVSRLRGH